MQPEINSFYGMIYKNSINHNRNRNEKYFSFQRWTQELNMSENEMRDTLFNKICDELDEMTYEEIKEEIVNKGSEDILDYLILTATSDDRSNNPP